LLPSGGKLAFLLVSAAGLTLSVLGYRLSHAEEGLQVGACVVADTRHPGRVTEVLPYGYGVKGYGPSDSAILYTKQSVRSAPCQSAGPNAGQGALAIGSCVVADKWHPGRITGYVPNGYVVKGFGPNDRDMIWTRASVVPGPCLEVPNPNAGLSPKCFASDVVAGQGLEADVRRTILTFSRVVVPGRGSDGAATTHISALRIGGSHPATASQQVEYQTIEGRPIYDARASFTVCTDTHSQTI
jgi:hypothetical protein